LTASARALELTQIAAQAASDKLAENIVAIDVTDRHALNDVFLIASSRNERQTPAIADEIADKMLAAGVKLLRQEGKAAGTWIVLDFGDIQCHIMQEESRMFYEIERLWKDCPFIQLDLQDASRL
jgi:ribosome-associated protein